MKLTAATSAKAKAGREFAEWAIASAEEWGWDYVIQMIAEVMGYTKGRTDEEKIVLLYARAIGWPALLRKVAQVMQDKGVYLNVWVNHTPDDEDDDGDSMEAAEYPNKAGASASRAFGFKPAIESPSTVGAVDPSATDPGTPTPSEKSSTLNELRPERDRS